MASIPRRILLLLAAAAAALPCPSPARGAGPGEPALAALGEADTGAGEGNAEIVDRDPATGLAFLTCGGERSVAVVDLEDPAKPRIVRRDSLGGRPTSVAVHPSAGWYLVAVHSGGPGGEDALEVRACATGERLRVLPLGRGRGPDCTAIRADGKWAVVCNEAEAPWMPGSVAFLAVDPAGARTPAEAAARIGAPVEIPLEGLAPSAGSFSARWVDRPLNAPLPEGVEASTARGAVALVNGETRASDDGGPIEDGAEVVFRRGGTVVKARFTWDGEVSGGNDGNVFLFPLDGTALSLEPEFAAFSPGGDLCVVTLQENNALLVFDLSGGVPRLRAEREVFGLGAVDAPADLKRKDPGKDSPAKFEDRLRVEREPDGVAVAELGGRLCAVIADEGDTWGPSPGAKGKDRARGGRTVSVVDLATGRVLGDTGNGLDAAADACGRWGAFLEAKRADRGGCEPENLVLVRRGERTLAVVGCERANALALVDVTDPAAPRVLGMEGMGGTGKGARRAPEGLRAYRAGDRDLVLAAFEGSGTLGVFEVR